MTTDPPENLQGESRNNWSIVAAGALMTCVAIGVVFSLAVFLNPSSLGMALGPVLGGWLYDRSGSYTWMYIGSMAVGLGAVAIAFAFPKAESAAHGCLVAPQLPNAPPEAQHPV